MDQEGDVDFARVQGREHVGFALVLKDLGFRVGAGGIGVVHGAQQHSDCLVAHIIGLPHLRGRPTRCGFASRTHHHRDSAGVIAFGIEDAFGALLGNGEAGADHVDLAGDQSGQHGAELHVGDLKLFAKLLGHPGGKLDVEPHHLAAGIDERHRFGNGGRPEPQHPVGAGQRDIRHGRRAPLVGEPAFHHVVVGAVGLQVGQHPVDRLLQGGVSLPKTEAVPVADDELRKDGEPRVAGDDIFQDRQVIQLPRRPCRPGRPGRSRARCCNTRASHRETV